jgi:hypothetical protein
MGKKRLILIAVIVFLSAILISAGMSPFPTIVISVIFAFIFPVLWKPPPRYKEFSDDDRLQATFITGGPPKVPIPDNRSGKGGHPPRKSD